MPARARSPVATGSTAPRRRRHVHRVPRHRLGARALGGGEAAGRAPGRGRRLRRPLPARGALRRPAAAPEHRAGVRLRPGPRQRAPLHRHGVRGRALLRRPAARAQAARRRRDRAIMRDACHGLDYAHRAGRGAPRREARQPARGPARPTTTKLADFGIAKAAEQTRITQVGSVLGTAAYLSPEQARGEEAGPASDIYSLGVCAYQFLTGRLPHEYSVAHRAGAQAAAGRRRADHELPPRGAARARRGDPPVPGARPGRALPLGARDGAGDRGGPARASRPTSRAALARRPGRDATRALAAEEPTGSTRALPRTSYAPPRRAGAHARARPARRAPRAGHESRAGASFALLLVLAAIGAVGVALLVSSDGGGSDVQAPDGADRRSSRSTSCASSSTRPHALAVGQEERLRSRAPAIASAISLPRRVARQVAVARVAARHP